MLGSWSGGTATGTLQKGPGFDSVGIALFRVQHEEQEGRTVWCNAIMQELLVLWTFVVVNPVMRLTVRLVAVRASEGQEVDLHATRLRTLGSQEQHLAIVDRIGWGRS